MERISDPLLLSTKLKIPAPRKNYVVRQVLFDKLSNYNDLSVVFICGGAGTGKTTLLSSFIKEKGLKNVGWLSLDESNANVYSFWLYFTAAVNTFLPGGEDLFTLMRANYDVSHMEDLLIMQLNRLWGAGDCCLVLDDVHWLKDKALIKTLEFFIQYIPPNLHIIMLSREDPPLYLGPLAVSGRLLYIDSKQMLLSSEEGMAFLRHTLALTSNDDELDELNRYAEGWIGGLQLAAAASLKNIKAGELLRAGGGIAAQYLTREIIGALTRDEQEFLLETGYLSYLDCALCHELFVGLTPKRFKEIVEGLIKKNLLIICIDEDKEIYRYHNMLAEYLDQQLSARPGKYKKALFFKGGEGF